MGFDYSRRLNIVWVCISIVIIGIGRNAESDTFGTLGLYFMENWISN